MDLSGKRAFQLLRKLAYVRVSGTEAELRAAEALLQEALDAGAQGALESFSIPDGVVTDARLEVVAPYQKEYECSGYIRSDSTPEGGLEADFRYVEGAQDVDLLNMAGKVALINGRLNYDLYEKLKRAQVAGIIGYSGTNIDVPAKTDLDIRKLRETLTDEFGFTVAVNVRAKDAVDIVRRGATRVRLHVQSERAEGTSHNVRATLTGTEYPDEIIVFGAHYDSVHFSTGVYDNMSGSVIIMELLRYFAAHPPKRTMQFCWYGSEEQGLLGSKAYVAAHKDELDKIQCMVNVDVGGSVLGSEHVIVTGSESLASYIGGLLREDGLSAEVTRDTYSSDSIPFADHGVPAVNFARFGAPGASYIHDRQDKLSNHFLSADALLSTARVTLAFAKRIANAVQFPVAREMPKDMVEKVDTYLRKKKDAKKP